MPASVFISYSHDSDAHRSFVRSIADKLRGDGLNCHIDQYINGSPPEGWQRWMETQVEQADFVLLVCTETYLKRYRGLDKDGGRGVTFEGVVISQTLYDHYYRNTKFIPVIPEGGDFEHVPLPLKGYSTYTLPQDYTDLYRVLTDQHATPAPEIGDKVVLGTVGHSKMASGDSTISDSTEPAEQKAKSHGNEITDTMKAAWIGGAFALLAAIIAGLFTVMDTHTITIKDSGCANVNVGTSSGMTTQDCGDNDEK